MVTYNIGFIADGVWEEVVRFIPKNTVEREEEAAPNRIQHTHTHTRTLTAG